MENEIDSQGADGLKIREIREKYDRDEVEINVMNWLSPRSGSMLQSPTEPNKRRRMSKSYSDEELLWELPLDKKVNMQIISGMNEGQTKDLNVGNVRIDYAEVYREGEI